MASSSKPKHLSVERSIWEQCCGALPFKPAIGAKVYYFAKGHLQHMGLSDKSEPLSDHPPILCIISSISYRADTQTEEMYARIKLKAVAGDDVLEPFHLRDERQEGFYGREVRKTHVNDRLYVPFNNNGVLTAEDLSKSSLTLMDVSQKTWSTKFMSAHPKPGFFLSGAWNTLCLEKDIIPGDSIFFKKVDFGLVFSLKRKENRAAGKYVESKKSSKNNFEKAFNSAKSGEEFRVRFYPNWIDFLVDPSYYAISNQQMRVAGIKVRLRTAKSEGKLIKALKSGPFRWNSLKVRMDGIGNEVRFNSWEIVPVPV